MDQLDPLPRRIAWFAPWTWKRRWWIAAALLVVGYPLSIGPASGLASRGVISDAAFYAIYAPVIWIATTNDSLYWWAVWYTNCFY